MPITTIRREPLTYSRHAPFSFFKDCISADRGDRAALDRLNRHRQEMAVENERRDRAGFAALRRNEIEHRTNPDRVQGTGGYFAPPGWLIDHFQTARRPGRVLPDLIDQAGTRFPLPQGVQSLNIPLLNVGTDELEVPDLSADPDQDFVDTAKTSPVVTVTGLSDVALALLEQSPPGAHLDWAIFKDLTEAYDADLGSQVLYGTGTNGQFTGIVTACTANNSIVYTSGTPSFGGMYQSIAQAAAQVGDVRDMPPEVWLMRTARWAWMGSSVDSSQRPMVPPSMHGPVTSATAPNRRAPVSSMLGWPVHLDESISATLGAAGNQDHILSCRPMDLILMEGTPTSSVHLEPLSGVLGARIVLRNYAAFLVGHASSIATVGGSGCIVPAGF
jgi:hypothetical protein